MAKWEKPVVLETSELARNMGQCEEGSTPDDGVVLNCTGGESTGHIECACMSGGLAGSLGGCMMGLDPSYS